MASSIFIIGTLDTKADELRFAADCVKRAGGNALLVDVSTARPDPSADITAEEVAAFHPKGRKDVLALNDRGPAVTAMGEALKHFLLSRNDIGAVLGLGGSCNTAIVTEAMRALPIGVPKLMVSTLASGNVSGFVGPTDIMMLHAVTDIAGLNAISRTVIANAAHAVTGMAINTVPKASTKPAVGYTMFGVTTTCVNSIRSKLEPETESFVFHATGTGGQSFEKLADSGFLAGAIDITTTEVADYLFGGSLPCTEDRFGAFIRNPIPYVGSVGALDMVNFGARETVPQRYAERKFHVHNAHVTLMRTSAEENAAMGLWIVQRINRMKGPVSFLLPLRGVSEIDAEGKPFYDPESDAALFDAIRAGWHSSPNRKLIELDLHINDPAFAEAAFTAFREIT